MYLLNLSLLQFLSIFGAVSALSIALFLLDRSRRRLVVSTLRFWMAAGQPAAAARHRRVRQPWSLVLQLAGMALVLLAIGQLRLGTPQPAGRDHVIVLDTSAWMAARTADRTLMDAARERARQYLQALPARDRVMLVRSGAMATPATAFELDRKAVASAIARSEPTFTALNLDRALAFARRIQGHDGHRAGEIAVISPLRVAPRDPAPALPPRNLRVIAIPDTSENTGLRQIGLRRGTADAGLWEIHVAVRNYGARPRTVTVSLDFGPPGPAGRVAAGSRLLALPPGAESAVSFAYRTSAAGMLGVHLFPHDSFPNDDQAEVELPALPSLPVVVYSDQPELLRPVLAAAPRVAAVYRRPDEYHASDAGLVILDRFIPPERPHADSLWIEPPAMGSPIPVRSTVEQVPFTGWDIGWDTGHPAAAGLRSRNFPLDRAEVFETAPSDGRIGEVAAGPVMVARPGKPKIAVLGFHPVRTGMRYELATPLLFASLLRWFAPDTFRPREISAASVGTVQLAMDRDTSPAGVKVTAEDGSALPFTLRERTLSFFSGAPGVVTVAAGDREYIYSLTLPELWETTWTPPADARLGVPRFAPGAESPADLWRWLAVTGGLVLLAEWMLYGRFRRGMVRAKPVAIASAPAEARR